jgi:hypothetical protein
MSATSDMPFGRAEGRPFYIAIVAGLACAFVIGKALPLAIGAPTMARS